MGKHCPDCNKYVEQVGVIGKDLKPVVHADDALAFKLSCGHLHGGEAYKKFLADSRDIDQQYRKQCHALGEERNNKLAALSKAFVQDANKGGK